MLGKHPEPEQGSIRARWGPSDGVGFATMFSPYRRVLSHPGALAFSSSALLARLPTSMVGLGLVLLVQHQTGSYGLAGAVSAVYVLAQACFAVLHGRLLDRLGQARVLTVAVCAFAVALTLRVLAVLSDAATWTVWTAAAVAGACVPQVGACVRARWAHVLGSGRELQTAFALEGVLDELVFVVGPVLVTTLAAGWHPAAALGAATAAGLVGTLLLASRRETAPPARARHTDAGPRPPLGWSTLGPLAVVSLSLGALFGVAEVATVAFADEQGSTGLAGPLLAVWAAGSLCGGLVSGAIRWRIGVQARVRVGMGLLTLAMVPLPFIGSPALLACVLLCGGCVIAPTLIAALTLVEQRVPSERLTEGMAVVQTGLVAGVAPGAAIGGVLIDSHGAAAGFAVAIAAGVLGTVSAQLVRGGAAATAHVPS